MAKEIKERTICKLSLQKAFDELDGAETPHPISYNFLFHSFPHLKEKLVDLVELHFQQMKAAPAVHITCPKGALSFRRFSRLTPVTAAVLERVARELAREADEKWGPYCYSFRFDKSLPLRLYPEVKHSDRQRWKKFEEAKNIELRKCHHPQDPNGDYFALKADVARFFDFVDHSHLNSALKQRFPRKAQLVDAFSHFLKDLMSSERALPVGPQASFFFADILLLQFDDSIRGKNEIMLRWADDSWLFHKYPSMLESSFREALKLYNSIGLNFNDTKVALVDPALELADVERFSIFRKRYYKLPSNRADLRAAFLCGVILERSAEGLPYNKLDKFILNRLKECFLTDRASCEKVEGHVLEAFNESYGRARDSLQQWHSILKILPSNNLVIKTINDVFERHSYPLFSDKARLLELSTHFTESTQNAKPSKASLKKIAENAS